MIEHLTSLELRIIEQFGKIVKKFPILHHGWEMDAYGYVVTDGSRKKIVITNHSNPMVVGVDYLKNKISEYGKTIKDTKEIIEIFENGTDQI